VAPVVPQNSDPDPERINIIEDMIGKRTKRLATIAAVGEVLGCRL
jgi:hypothetical protein